MNEEEIIKYAKIFSNAKGDTYKINFVNENKTIDEVEIWKEILKLIDKKDKVIDLMAFEISENTGSCPLDIYNWENKKYDNCNNCNNTYKECFIEYFYKEVEEEDETNRI